MVRRNWKHAGAYTLIEVLVVVMIIGIAGAIVVPHMPTVSSMGVQAAGRMIIADIIFAQNDAVAHQKPRKVIFDTANGSYRITDANENPIAASWKGGAEYVVAVTGDSRFEGVTLANADFGATATLEFDDLGTSINGGTIDVIANEFQYRITVATFTGRLTIEPIAGG